VTEKDVGIRRYDRLGTMRLIVTGATGLAGAEVLRQSFANDEIQKVTALARRPLALTHPKLTTVVHGDFLNYDAALPQLSGHDACLWCLGVSQRDVDEPEYIRITRDYTLAGAAAMLQVNPGLTFGFLSGGGAKSTERSLLLFGRVKGQTENRLGSGTDRPGIAYTIVPPVDSTPSPRYSLRLRSAYLTCSEARSHEASGPARERLAIASFP